MNDIRRWMTLCEAEPSPSPALAQRVWSFAIMGKRRKLHWVNVIAPDEGSAIKGFRQQWGYDVKLYAGPLPQRCAMKHCHKQAVTKIGKGSWLPVCQEHSEGAFPHHTSYE